MNTSDFYYELPQELIAQTPPADRSASRLLLYDRNTRSITDGVFSDVASHLHPGDVLVRNTTRVIPARLIGVREDTGGHMEFLLLRRAEGDRWECLAKPARRARPGQEYRVGDGLRVRVLGDTGAEGGKLVELYPMTTAGADNGYVMKISASGSQGSIVMMVGVDADKAITGISVVSHAETSGIGTKVVGNEPNAAGEPVLDQFIGESGAGSLVVGKNIIAVSGATVSTKGINMGANAALAVAELLG